MLTVVCLLTYFQFLSFVHNSYAVTFPGAVKQLPAQCAGLIDDLNLRPECGCTMKNVEATGFPFRNDINDACQQDGSKSLIIQSINWAVQFIIVGLVYVGLHKLVGRRKN